MNIWLIFATLLLGSLLPVIIACLRGSMLERFVAVQMAQVIAVLVMLLLATGFSRTKASCA